MIARLTDAQRAISDEFNAVLGDAHEFEWSDQLNCHGYPERYVDYEPDEVPSKERAEWLCAGCPALALCAQFAKTTHPTWGVWGGKVYQPKGDKKGDKPTAIQKAN